MGNRIFARVSALGAARLLALPLILASVPRIATAAQCIVTAPDVVTAAVLRAQPSIQGKRLGALKPGDSTPFVASQASWYQTQMSDGTTAFVSKRWTNLSVCPAGGTPSPVPPAPPPPAPSATGGPVPLLAQGHAVDWWFAFKLNAVKFPGCGNSQTRTNVCPFGGSPKSYPLGEGQQFVFASSESPQLTQGAGCVGTTEQDPVGATYDEIFNGRFSYVVWNDQFKGSPATPGCAGDCGAGWGHSKGMVAWDDSGNGLVLQVTTPSWPGSGNQAHPRQGDGNTLGCVTDDNVLYSQHFFALKLSKDDLVALLRALGNASVNSDPTNLQVVAGGGPADIQSLVTQLGRTSDSTTATLETLSSGVRLISKPAALHVPPWHLVSSLLGALPLRTATWWTAPDKIPDTTAGTVIDCWDARLTTRPGPVESSALGIWNGTQFGLIGTAHDGNHAKFAVSLDPARPLTIFADMNQEGALNPGDDAQTHCAAHQNARGGVFFVLQNAALTASVTALMTPP